MHRSFSCHVRLEERRLIGASASIMLQRNMGVETDGRSPARSTELVRAPHEYWLDPAATSGWSARCANVVMGAVARSPLEDALATPITALGAQYRVEGPCINRDHFNRLYLGVLIASGQGSRCRRSTRRPRHGR
jgi:hypothetical protein